MSTVDKPQAAATASDKAGEKKYKVIGTRPIRHDGTDKVTGRAQYGADIQLSGLLYGAIHRSPLAHATIKRIDTSKAAALPGVHAVVTSGDLSDPASRISDLGEGSVDVAHLSRNVLAREKVLYKGHAVAAVAADNIHVAEEAARLIEVEYEPSSAVLDCVEAMRDDAPILLPSLRTDSLAGEAPDKPTNIAKHLRFEKGNVDEGFATAKVIVEREFRTSTVHQGYIEPHNATALWNSDGHLSVWTSTQGSFMVRQQLSDLLELPISKITVIPMEIGGGFGGKIAVYLQPVAALLSKKTGKPVKLLMDRAAVFEATGPTPGSHVRVKMGADAEGRLTAAEAWIVFEAGAFPGSPISAACMCVFSCYDVPNGRIDGYDVVVNKPRTNAYRAPGATNAAFATETVVDEICEQLGIDPLEFRLKNASKKGTRRIDGPVFSTIGMRESVEAIQSSGHWNTPQISPPEQETPIPACGESASQTGRGVASGFWFNAGLQSSVTATVNADGTVALVEGSTDIGGTRTSIAMQLAETLGIAAEDVHPTVVDTDRVGYTDVTGGSRVTYATGWAAYEAGRDIQQQFIERAAEIWDVDASQVKYEAGQAASPAVSARNAGSQQSIERETSSPLAKQTACHVFGPGGKVFTFKELAAKIAKTGAPVIGRGSSAHNEPGGAFATHVVDVEVDPDTGKVDILRYTASQDVGTAVHPSYVEGQMQGGVVQGIGWALNEEYFYDERGVMRNATFLDYRIPTCYDVPMIDTIIVEVPNPGHPYGVRGAGEVPIVPPPAAIANAIYRAVGVRMRELPMSPPRLLHEILKKRREQPSGQES